MDQNAWSKYFLTDEVLTSYRHWSNNQCEIFNIGDLCSCLDSLWLTTTGIWVSDSTAVIFSNNCF